SMLSDDSNTPMPKQRSRQQQYAAAPKISKQLPKNRCHLPTTGIVNYHPPIARMETNLIPDQSKKSTPCALGLSAKTPHRQPLASVVLQKTWHCPQQTRKKETPNQ